MAYFHFPSNQEEKSGRTISFKGFYLDYLSVEKFNRPTLISVICTPWKLLLSVIVAIWNSCQFAPFLTQSLCMIIVLWEQKSQSQNGLVGWLFRGKGRFTFMLGITRCYEARSKFHVSCLPKAIVRMAHFILRDVDNYYMNPSNLIWNQEIMTKSGEYLRISSECSKSAWSWVSIKKNNSLPSNGFKLFN